MKYNKQSVIETLIKKTGKLINYDRLNDDTIEALSLILSELPPFETTLIPVENPTGDSHHSDHIPRFMDKIRNFRLDVLKNRTRFENDEAVIEKLNEALEFLEYSIVEHPSRKEKLDQLRDLAEKELQTACDNSMAHKLSRKIRQHFDAITI